MEDFATISQLRNECTGLRNGTSVPKGCFATAEILAEGAIGLRNGFAAKWRCRSEVAISQRTCWGCEMVSQLRADFAEASFRLRNLADPCFSLIFTLFLATNDFPSISLQFLLILIIQKPILNQNKLELKH